MTTDDVDPEFYCKVDVATWDTPLAEERGCEALSSHGITRNRPDIFRNQCSWKWTRTCEETCWGIRNHQGWYLTPQDFMKLVFKKSRFSRFPRFWQNRVLLSQCVNWFKAWGGHSWNPRWKWFHSMSRIHHMDVIWLLKSVFPMCCPLSLEDLLISQLSRLEENDSHHIPSSLQRQQFHAGVG